MSTNTLIRNAFVCAVLLVLALVPAAGAQNDTYRVTITNLTPGQIISPPIVVTHNRRAHLFVPGEPASDGLAAVAEDADAAALMDDLNADSNVLDVVQADGPLLPGASVTLLVGTTGRYRQLSALGMLVTTNDAFFGLDSLHFNGRRTSVTAYAWDAGSEANNESCASIPGPPCGNPHVRDTAGAEGFVHVHPGIHGTGDLDPATHDWNNPVVMIQVVRE